MGCVRTRRISLECLFVHAVASGGASKSAAATTTRAGLIRFRHFLPYLLDKRIDAESPRVTLHRCACAAIGSGIQVVLHAAERKDALAHSICWNDPLDGCRVGPPESLEIGEEVSFAAQNTLGNDRATAGSTSAVVMVTGQRRAAIVVIPGVGIEMVVQIIFVCCAVPGVGTALGDDLDLCASRAVEVRGLVGGIYLELFDAVEGRRHYARGSAADGVRHDAAGRVAGKARRIDLHAAVHVIGVLPAVEQKGALVHNSASHATVRGDAGLQGYESAGVSANRRQ